MIGSGGGRVVHWGEQNSPEAHMTRRNRHVRPARALLGVVLLALTGCAPDPVGSGTAPADRSPGGFVRAAGRGLAVDGEPFRLKAVNFSSGYYDDVDGSALLDAPHHTEQDVEHARAMGFNSIRLAVDGNWYLDDPDVFWHWLDRNVGWARRHDVRLILDLHVPIGGFWLDRGSEAYGFDLWSDPDLRRQNAQLWREIADRYRDEPAVAAYDLLNEPVTTDPTGEQWQEFAEQLVDAVRSVDENHLLVVEAVHGVDGLFGTAGTDPHFLVGDDNVVYDFHFYEPFAYTHQYAGWIPAGDGGTYPDPDALMATGEPRRLPGSTVATGALPMGTSEWREFDSGRVVIDDGSAAAAAPVAVVDGGMRGTVRFDAVTVTEYAPDGTELRRVVDDRIGAADALNWYEWQSGDGTAPAAQFEREPSGHDDDGGLSVTDASPADSVAGWSNEGHLFEVVPGNRYRVRGWMRGEDVSGRGGTDPRIRWRLDVYAQPAGPEEGRFLPRDRTYLEEELREHLEFGAAHGVPMSVLEFGAVRQTFETEGKGGARWVADVLDLLEEHELSFGYWEYRGPDMGILRGGEEPSEEPAGELEAVLRRELR
ncbi:glycoside hydrolase family 5 protein [Kocuria sp. M1R5S2]|uniref:glycoside hydrolase family 5 protein n=1 Tax=Kocuria rhizosphaerae TaxID=3376285 RepID=UPI00379B7155